MLFKFSDSSIFRSSWASDIWLGAPGENKPDKGPTRTLRIQSYIIESDIPMRVSRLDLTTWVRCLCFRSNRIPLPNGQSISLHIATYGYMILPAGNLRFKGSSRADWILVSNQGSSNDSHASGVNMDTSGSIRKMHLHLSHANGYTLRRILRMAARRYNDSDNDLVLSRCRCVKKYHNMQSPSFPVKSTCARAVQYD